MNGRSCRRKGHAFERAVAARLAEVFGEDVVRRGIQYRAGEDAPDVVCPAFWIECKRGQATNPRAALRQARADAKGSDRWPVAVTKNDREDIHVTMMFDDFVALVTEWHTRGQAGRNS
jgi:hypothetical protein